MGGPAVLILAAGRSARMRGADKLLQDVGGEALIARQVRRALATGRPTYVTLSPEFPARERALTGLAVMPVIVADVSEGMAASLRAGIAAVGARPVLLVLADMPEITSTDMRALIDRHRDQADCILRGAAEDGTPGHPVLFPVWALAELSGLVGDVGARDVLARHRDRVAAVPLPGRHALIDLDTPEDWAAWRAKAD